ncbi:MAG: TonB-dependent receptor [uncultured Campylobacterales bacterium]|uniref:TonB-dependent receptor n=1 Tax=uncultured Campylobacterales bacterium TaxID=352960 RepID=A0A6S6SR48_9BACT|nr:MAG: TonB-dependent receptor [uncultured Campylobacterales bacterium]
MKKFLFLAGIGVAFAYELDSVYIEDTIGTNFDGISNENFINADVSTLLFNKTSNISISRRSAIANDINLRGQKKDNINILIDNAKIHGACPNRMDPPVSHILSNNIESIDIIEGPYDVENFGTLSGLVKVNTKKPSDDYTSSVNLNFGDFGYQKYSFDIGGASGKLKYLVSSSYETSDQYEDGNGDTLSEQLANSAPVGNQYKDNDIESFTKKTFMGKLFYDISDEQYINLSYTRNESDDVLYPSTPMDAVYDDSNIYTLEYGIQNLGKYSDSLELNVYHSDVEHPMSNENRNMSMTMRNSLTSKISGAKLINKLKNTTFGLDMSNRNWDGEYQNGVKSINDVDTKNLALFAKHNQNISENLGLEYGLRADTTTIQSANQDKKNYDSLNANILATLKNNDTKYIVGFGKSSRVPDGKELYHQAMNGTQMGNPNLKQTKNYEVDFIIEKPIAGIQTKTKAFYSYLDDYIYYNSSLVQNRYQNIDASIYGFELSGDYLINDSLMLELSSSYKRGEKKDSLQNQTNKNLADINPIKTVLGLSYTNENWGEVGLESVMSGSWSNFDSDNGEQAISGYAVFNIKYSKTFKESFNITLGIENLLDKTYNTSNTYNELTLMNGGGDTMLLNEPGRYIYTNISYRF